MKVHKDSSVVVKESFMENLKVDFLTNIMGPKFKSFCDTYNWSAIRKEMRSAFRSGYLLVGYHERDAAVEAVFKTDNGYYIGIRRQDDGSKTDCYGVPTITKYLTDPLAKQPSLFWRAFVD